MYDSKPWLQNYPKEVQHSFDYPEQNLAQFLIDTAAKYPKHPALHFLGKTTRYDDLLKSTYRFANALTELGFTKGDRVAIMLPNCPQAVIAYYGILLIGGIVVETNPLYMERELQHQMADSGAIAMVTLDLLFKRVMNVQSETNLKHVIVTSIKDALPFPKNVLYPLKQKKDGAPLPQIRYENGVFSFRELCQKAPERPRITQVDAKQDIALLQYTGGTTGISKGVMLTHYNLTVNTIQTRNWCYRSEIGKERFLAALPFFHVFGMTVLMNQAIYMAGMLVLLPRFDVNLTLQLIDRMKVTVFPGAPTMYIALIHHPNIKDYDLSSIEICVSGSAPLPLEVRNAFERITGGRLIEGYGLTEAAPVTHSNCVWEKRKSGSIGVPFPDTEAKIVDMETGEEKPFGQIGELAVKGPQVMLGYWNREDETANVLKDGWLLTGDMAMMDDEGFCYIMDRKKDMIIASGYNIYPREIEEVLFEHPGVKECAVVGIPDEYRGETVKAYIIKHEHAALTDKELEQWCKQKLAAYKVPKKYEFRDQLPKTIVGKVLRRKLLEEELENYESTTK